MDDLLTYVGWKDEHSFTLMTKKRIKSTRLDFQSNAVINRKSSHQHSWLNVLLQRKGMLFIVSRNKWNLCIKDPVQLHFTLTWMVSRWAARIFPITRFPPKNSTSRIPGIPAGFEKFLNTAQPPEEQIRKCVHQLVKDVSWTCWPWPLSAALLLQGNMCKLTGDKVQLWFLRLTLLCSDNMKSLLADPLWNSAVLLLCNQH